MNKAELVALNNMPDVARHELVMPQVTLDWVGMSGIHQPLLIKDGDKINQTQSLVQIYVNLGDELAKGIHMSRLYLILDEHSETRPLTTAGLKLLLRSMLESHRELSSRAFVQFDFDYYLRRSALVSDNSLAAGLLLQKMPGQAIDEDDWNRLGFVAATLKTDDFPGADGVELIGKLFAEDDVRVYEGQNVTFSCRCSQQRAEEVLRMLGEDETREALDEQGSIDVTCEYCGRQRSFDSVDISRVFTDNVVAGPDNIQ